jgi:hypothetical protein
MRDNVLYLGPDGLVWTQAEYLRWLEAEVRRLRAENARLVDAAGGRVGWGPPTGPRTATWGEVCQEDAAS